MFGKKVKKKKEKISDTKLGIDDRIYYSF